MQPQTLNKQWTVLPEQIFPLIFCQFFDIPDSSQIPDLPGFPAFLGMNNDVVFVSRKAESWTLRDPQLAEKIRSSRSRTIPRTASTSAPFSSAGEFFTSLHGVDRAATSHCPTQSFSRSCCPTRATLNIPSRTPRVFRPPSNRSTPSTDP